jgi:hypothetical protein
MSALVIFDWQCIFLFSSLLQSIKEKAQYFKNQNERRSKLMFTKEKCLLCVVSILKQSSQKCVVSCQSVSLEHSKQKKCVYVHYTFSFCLFEKDEVKFLVLCCNDTPHPHLYSVFTD